MKCVDIQHYGYKVKAAQVLLFHCVKMFSDFGYFVMEKCRKEPRKTLHRDSNRNRQCYIPS